MPLRETVVLGLAGLIGTAALAQTASAPAASDVAAAVPAASASSIALAPSADRASGPVSAAQVRAAARAVAKDPLMPGMDKVRVLRFKKDKNEDEEEKKAEKDSPADLTWWLEAVDHLSSGLRLAIWLIGAAVVVWLLLRLRDLIQGHGGRRSARAQPPTHVGSLDIRPESLPDDLGAAARAHWARHEPRAALSLLYRGALSRLVHARGVPIRAASTEQEVLDLAADRLAEPSHAYLRMLVAAWQTVAYAQRALDEATFDRLCADFDRHLPAETGVAR